MSVKTSVLPWPVLQKSLGITVKREAMSPNLSGKNKVQSLPQTVKTV